MDKNFKRLLTTYKTEKDLQFIMKLKEGLQNEGDEKINDDGGMDGNAVVVQEEGNVECCREEREKEKNGSYVPDSRMSDKKLLAFIRQEDKEKTHGGVR